MDKEVINAIKSTSYTLRNISYDKKKSELDKIFNSKNMKNGIKLLTSLNLDEYLDIDLKKVVYTSTVLGIWAQIYNNNYPFTRIEKENIKDIHTIVKNRTISKYDIYKYGLYKTSIAAEILGINKKVIVKLERNLKINSRKDIDISAEEIIEIVNQKPGIWLSKLYEDIEINILNNNLKNENDKLKEYILKKYN